ncbi:MAG: ABC transporter permease [Sulfolobales archaeon]
MSKRAPSKSTQLTARGSSYSETLFRLVLKKKSFLGGVALIAILAIPGILASVLTPYSPLSREVVAADFAIPEWAAPPDVPRNIIKSFTEFSVAGEKVSGDVSVTTSAGGVTKIEIRGEGKASVLLVSNDYVYYPYRPAKQAQVDIVFNATYPAGAGEAWYNVEVIIVNEDLLARGDKYVVKLALSPEREYSLEVPKGVYSLYDLVTTKVAAIYPYHKGPTTCRTLVTLPNLIRNIQQGYITEISDPWVKDAISQEFSMVNTLRDLILEKDTKIRVLVNVTYYCNPNDFLMQCSKGALEVKLNQVKLWIKGEAFGVLGTNAAGNDVWTQYLYGSRSAIAVGITVATLANLISLVVGLIAGYRADTSLDHAITFLIDVMNFIPTIPLIIVIGLTFGRNLWTIYTVIVLLSWQGGARIIRQWTMTLRASTFVEAARALGASEWRIMMKHLAPQLLPYLVYRIVTRAPAAVYLEASIQLLGFGDPEAPTWGRMINEAYYRGALLHNAWWWIMPPMLGLILFGIGFVMIGMALDEVANPRLKR